MQISKLQRDSNIPAVGKLPHGENHEYWNAPIDSTDVLHLVYTHLGWGLVQITELQKDNNISAGVAISLGVWQYLWGWDHGPRVTYIIHLRTPIC